MYTLITVALSTNPFVSGGELGNLSGLELLLPSWPVLPSLTEKVLFRRVGNMRTILKVIIGVLAMPARRRGLRFR